MELQGATYLFTLAALTVILFLSGWAYLQALRLLSGYHVSRLDKM
jgi:hypothetical protein